MGMLSLTMEVKIHNEEKTASSKSGAGKTGLLLLSHFSHVRLCETPSLGFSRQEHLSGLPFPSPMHKSEKWKWSRSVMSDSSRPHGLQPAYQAASSTGFSRQEYWGCHGLLCSYMEKNETGTPPNTIHKNKLKMD